MSVRGLVKHLAELDEPPVSLNAIQSWITHTQRGFVDRITFRPTSKFAKLAGALHETRWIPNPRPYAEPELVADIYFNENLPPQMIRVVCCKEMLHFFDSETERTYTEEQLSALVRDWGSESTTEALLEKIGGELANQIWALVVLAPLHIVERYRADYESGRMTDPEVAERFDIPDFMVKTLFSSEFKVLAEQHLK